MAAHGNKRQKTTHLASSDDEDEASFVSSAVSDSAELSATDNTDEEEQQDSEGNSAESDVPSDGDLEAESKVARTRNGADAGMVNGHSKRPERSGREPGTQAGAAAYASGTFKSNAFKMQVDELLGQIRPRHGKREAAAEQALHAIKRAIEQLPATEPCSITDAERDLISNKTTIPFPFPRPPKDAKYKLAYSKPSSINVVGSFMLKTASRARDRLEVDMVVNMPKSMFDEKDYLKYRYFYKRAHYLARLASGLKKSHGTEFSLCYQLFHDDPLKTILTVDPVHPSDTSSTAVGKLQWRINIIPCIEQDHFSATKLQPDRNCVRQARHGDQDTDTSPQAPTPFYNSSLRADMLMTAYLKLVHTAAKRCAAFTDACLLGNTWLRQRGLESSIAAGGFGNFEWTALLALSLQGGGPAGRPLLSDRYSSYQLVKAALQLLAMKDLRKRGLVIGENNDAPDAPSGGEMPMLWDSTRSHNLLYKMSPWSYNLLRAEARNTLNALGDQFSDGFNSVFILNLKNPLYRFDSIVRLPLRVISKAGEQSLTSPNKSLVQLHSVLKQGLGDRVNLISLSVPATPSWKLGSAPPKSQQTTEITIGLAVNPANVNRTVEHGPAAENQEAAAAFREFWGEKSELRRFKDGSILESVVWNESQANLVEEIVRYILKRHFALTADQLILSFNAGFSQYVPGGAELSAFQHLMTYFNRFENDLRDLREMPLSIRQIMPADAQLRYSSIRAPPNGKTNQKPVPANVVLQFEGSGRWPDDLAAIQHTKIAFLLKLAEMLQEASDLASTRLGLENEDDPILNQGFLEVTYNSEATFRLRIYHDREQTLLERQLKDAATDPRSKELAAQGLAAYKRDYIRAPAHTQALARLCSRHVALSGAIRLTKRWFASHLLANHVADEIIELFVARTFVQSWPWATPSSAQVGFLRTLFWLSRWDWRAEPLVVDFSDANGGLTELDVRAIHTRFEAWRKLDPALNRVVLFMASNVDPDGTTWTDGAPMRVVAGRMTALARAACVEIERQQSQLEPASLFSSPLRDFDFVLYLDADLATGSKSRSKNRSNTFKNLELDDTDADSIGFDPVKEFVHELETLYGSAIVFFIGASERPVIGGLWSPITAARSWKVNLAYSTIPSDAANGGDVQAVLNKTAVLSEIARLGGDLIKNVEVYK